MKTSLFLIIVGSLLFGACGQYTNQPAKNETTAAAPAKNAPSATPDEGHDAPRISLADAKKAYDDGDAVIVDVRDVNAYKQERVKGSVNITVQDIDANIDKLPKGKKIIAYCS